MEYTTLGKTGLTVSKLCCRTWRFSKKSDGVVETGREEPMARNRSSSRASDRARGGPEMMAVVALSGVTVVLFGMALVRLFEYIRITDLSIF